VIVSTGQTNWAKEVTGVSGTLAYFLAEAHGSLASGSRGGGDRGAGRSGSESSSNWPGFYDSKASSSLMILNGSHRTASEDSTHNTVIVLPDYTFVNSVPESSDGATDLWKSSLDPSLGRGGKVLENFHGGSELKSWPLPYNIVILICGSAAAVCFETVRTHCHYYELGSHKRRDARCGVTAPILEQGELLHQQVGLAQLWNLCFFFSTAIITSLNSRSWEVHTEIELDTTSPSLQNIPSSSDPSKRDEAVLSYIRNASEGNRTKRALLLKVSHVGGHKLAGNMVLYTPSGAGMWYGRVTPKEVSRLITWLWWKHCCATGWMT
jgi:hypothetical protein